MGGASYTRSARAVKQQYLTAARPAGEHFRRREAPLAVAADVHPPRRAGHDVRRRMRRAAGAPRRARARIRRAATRGTVSGPRAEGGAVTGSRVQRGIPTIGLLIVVVLAMAAVLEVVTR